MEGCWLHACMHTQIGWRFHFVTAKVKLSLLKAREYLKVIQVLLLIAVVISGEFLPEIFTQDQMTRDSKTGRCSHTCSIYSTPLWAQVPLPSGSSTLDRTVSTVSHIDVTQGNTTASGLSNILPSGVPWSGPFSLFSATSNLQILGNRLPITTLREFQVSSCCSLRQKSIILHHDTTFDCIKDILGK